MKKIISFLVGAGLFGVLNSAVFAQDFETFFIDVPIADENYDAIDWMAKQGVVQGYNDGTFGPDKVVNRVEFLKMVYTAQGLQDEVFLTELSDGVFSDVNVSAWYGPYVMYAKKTGTVEGYPDGSFKPDAPVNRAEAMKIALLEFYKGQLPDPGVVDLPYLDAQDFEAWYYDYVTFAISRCLVDELHVREAADEGLYFDLDKGMTRREVAEFLYRLKSQIDNLKADQCDEEFIEDPNDVKKSVVGVSFDRPGLFFAEYEKSNGWAFWGNVDVNVVAGGEEKNLFAMAQSDETGSSILKLSPDGNKLAIFLKESNDGKKAFYVSNSDGTMRYKISSEEIGDFVWSPESDSLVWVDVVEEDGEYVSYLREYVVGSGVDEGVKIADSAGYMYRFNKWIGDRVYVTRILEGTEDSGDLGYLRVVDGGIEGRFNFLFDNGIGLNSDFSFDWNGNLVVYAGDSREGFEIVGPYFLYMRDISRPGNQIELMESEEAFVGPVIGRDGKYVFYENGGVVWKMELATREVVKLFDVELANSFAGAQQVMQPLFVSGDGKSLIVLSMAIGENVEPNSTVFKVDTTSDNEFLKDENVFVEKALLNMSNVFWVE